MRLRFSLFLAAIALFAASVPDGQRWWSHVLYLADDKLQGRNTGSEGHRQAAAYVAGEFERAGLKPAGTSGYIQPVKFKTRRLIEEQSSLAIVRDGREEKLKLGEDAIIGVRSEPADSVEAPLVFVGYGLSILEKNSEKHYDDFAGMDVRGKIAVFISGGPPSIPGPLSSHYQSAGERSAILKRVGVVGACTIANPRSMDVPWSRSSLARFQPSMSLADPALDDAGALKISVTVNPAHADTIFTGSGHTFQEILDLANAGKPLPHFAIPAKLKATTRVERGEVESQNVAAILPGGDPKLKNEYVVLSAHLDHLGVGRPVNGDSIYNGAMDNASGIAAMLDVAQTLHESGAKLSRSVLFVAVTGEEKGLLGSKFFANHPTVDSKSIVADINTDMFLPLFPLHRLTVYGLDESDLGDDVRAVAKTMGIEVQPDPEPIRNVFIRSDQYSFIRRGIPALSMKVGYAKGSPEEQTSKNWLKERYHAPSDDVNQPVDKKAAADFDRLVARLIEKVANQAERPKWKDTSFFKRFA